MKYLYYIAGILIVFSMLAVYGLLDTRVEISKPAIVVNDRIITESEFKALLPSKPYYMTDDQYMDSIITKQLLVQEAIRQDINKEESFRKSVETYYEQSLIKILLDRKLNSLKVDVSEEEIKRYQFFSQNKVHISKFIYSGLAEALAGENPIVQKIATGFMNISDDLKFIVSNLEKGQSSEPFVSNSGVIVYKLDDITPMDIGKVQELDIEKISLFIEDKKKEVLMEKWSKRLKENAEIWRQK